MDRFNISADAPRLTRLIATLFDRWNLTDRERCALLGCELVHVESRLARDLHSFERRGLAQRCAQLLYIHKRLRLLFPDNRDLLYAWIKSSNQAFEGGSPLNTMINDGAKGYSRVIGYLNHAMQH